MISDIRKNKTAYSFLALICMLYLTFFFKFKSKPDYLFFATIVFAVSYVFWGIIHHARDKSLELKIVLEYILVAVLAVVAASTLLL